MKLLFAESAFNDLADIQAYYLKQGVPAVGNKFVAEIIAHVERFEDHSEISRIVPEYTVPKIRELIHPPFRIVYWLDIETINVIRVWRSERLLHLPNPN
jgi:plasmid stabilization system protein ParE